MDRLIIPVSIILLAFFIGIYIYPQMPERMASHWNAEGRVDGYMSKTLALSLMPLFSLGLYLLSILIPKIDPMKENIERFRGYYDNFIIVLIGFLFYVHIAMISWNLGFGFNMVYALTPAFSVLFYYCGVLMENAKRNWFIGFRTPWTLSDDEVWDKTHRVGGKLFKLCALLTLVSFPLIDAIPYYLPAIVILPAILIALYLIAYSYVEYQRVRK